MGLDNMPVNYPCEVVHGVSIDDSEDGNHCGSMMECGKCPWNEELGSLDGKITGIFGMHCWFRGKAGNGMLNMLSSDGYDPPLSFYGEGLGGGGLDDHNEGISTYDCLDLADWMEDHRLAFASIVAKEVTIEDARASWIQGYAYAIAWLRFVAKFGGSEIWY